jgi:hypothetical protein
MVPYCQQPLAFHLLCMLTLLLMVLMLLLLLLLPLPPNWVLLFLCLFLLLWTSRPVLPTLSSQAAWMRSTFPGVQLVTALPLTMTVRTTTRRVPLSGLHTRPAQAGMLVIVKATLMGTMLPVTLQATCKPLAWRPPLELATSAACSLQWVAYVP